MSPSWLIWSIKMQMDRHHRRGFHLDRPSPRQPYYTFTHCPLYVRPLTPLQAMGIALSAFKTPSESVPRMPGSGGLSVWSRIWTLRGGNKFPDISHFDGGHFFPIDSPRYRVSFLPFIKRRRHALVFCHKNREANRPQGGDG